MEFIKKLYIKYEQIIKYIFMGGLTTLVYFITRFTVKHFIYDIPFSSTISTIVAQVVAITFAFITNKKYVFKSVTSTKKELVKQVLSFYTARGVSFLIDMFITILCIEKFSSFFISIFKFSNINYNSGLFKIEFISGLVGSPEKLNEFLWAFLSQVIILTANYLFSKLVVFKKKPTLAVEN